MSEFKSKISLPPASNWFSANILAAGPGCWVAWGAKNGLVLLRDNDSGDSDNESDYPRVISHTEAYSDRCKVTGVAWCPVQGGAGRDKAELERLREEVNRSPGVKPAESELEVSLRPETAQMLEAAAADQVAEVLGVLRVKIVSGDNDEVIRMTRSQDDNCVRCRRLAASSGQELCARCDDVIRELDS